MPMGGESNATMLLKPGRYLLACLIPSSDGVPHLMKGMVRSLTVVKSAAPAALPKSDVVMTLKDYGFILSQPLVPGKQVIEVRNAGPQSHEIELVRLAPGKSMQDLMAWIEKPEGPAAGVALGGVSPLAVGGVSSFAVDLAPARYALICFVPDGKDGKAHLAHGMLQEIEVGKPVAANAM